MSSPVNSLDRAAALPQGNEAGQDAARLAHELANLLDGSLRHLGLALGQLQHHAQQTAQDEADALHRLHTAQSAMHQMAELLRRWMHDHRRQAPELFRQSWSLRDTVDHAVRLLAPAAQMRGIHLLIRLQPHAAQLPAGPLYPVIANALRNSIDALVQGPAAAAGKQIDLHADIHGEELRLQVADNGPGLPTKLVNEQGIFQFDGNTTKRDGHGVGLLLCREVVQALRGRLELSNRRDVRGAQLILIVPLSALEQE
jgi:signal transduction histidine kinase